MGLRKSSFKKNVFAQEQRLQFLCKDYRSKTSTKSHLKKNKEIIYFFQFTRNNWYPRQSIFNLYKLKLGPYEICI